MRTKLIIAIAIAVWVVGSTWVMIHQHDQITSLKKEVTEYKAQSEKDKKDALEKSKRIQELNKVIQNSKDSLEYSGIRIDSALLAELRKQYLRKGN